MLRITLDRAQRCMIIHVIPGPQTDADWQQGAEAFVELDAEAARQNKDGIIFVITEKGSERPNATWRRKLAEQRAHYKAKRRCLVMVTESTLFRGALIAVNWLAPKTEGVNLVAATIAEGVATAEAWRGEPIPMLRGLLSSAG